MDHVKLIKSLFFYGMLFCGSCQGSIINAALKKPTNQSSDYIIPLNSKMAVDGSRNNSVEADCSHTEREKRNWWTVDLGEMYTIYSVTLTNRFGWFERLQNFSIIGGNEPFSRKLQNLHLCHHQHKFQSNRTVEYKCAQLMHARYVTINQTNTTGGILTLCEVEVLANNVSTNNGQTTIPSSTITTTTTTVSTTTTTSTITATNSPTTKPDTGKISTTYPTQNTFTSSITTTSPSTTTTNATESLKYLSTQMSAILPAAVGASVAVLVLLIVVIVVIIFRMRSNITARKNLEEETDRNDNTNLGHERPVATVKPVALEVVVSEEQVELDTVEGAYANGHERPVATVKPVALEEVVSEEQVELDTVEGAYANVQNRTEIKVCDIGRYVENHKTQDEPFKEEYESLPNAVHTWDECDLNELKSKNRYRNIYPYNNSRVKLQQLGNNPLSTYINASLVKDYKGDVSYIAALGPTQFTLDDVWRMIWERNVQLVVMVAKLVEDTKVNCEQYWPSEDKIMYGDITVLLKEEKFNPCFSIRTFQVSKGSESRTVTHYQYTAWPDKKVPNHLPSLCKIRELMKSHRQNSNTPILVHCSAGVGRTGTIIAMDILLDQADAEDKVDIYRCVDVLRTQRTNLVQTLVQYIFLHDALNEIQTVGSTMVSRDQLHSMVISSDNQELSKQFEFLQSIAPCFSDSDMELGKFQNKDFNRDMNIIPADSLRVKLLSSPEMYINAVYVQGFRKEIAHIATQIPMPNTVDIFWNMVYEQKCTSIVCLQTDSKYTSWFSKKESSAMFDDLAVITTQVESKDIMTKYDITVGKVVENEYANVDSSETENQPKDSINLSLFMLEDWSSKSLNDRDIASFLEGIGEIHKNQGSGLISTVICRNGSHECGLYIVLSWLLQMADTEQEVDVFHVVKQIRKTRPQFISDMEHYLFLHKAVQMYVNHQHSNQADE